MDVQACLSFPACICDKFQKHMDIVGSFLLFQMYVYIRLHNTAKVKHGMMDVSINVDVMIPVRDCMSVMTGELKFF